jgi:hypothetical protein
MSSRSRIALGAFALALGVSCLLPQSVPDAFAQPKGGQKGKDKDKDLPPPNFTLPDSWVKAFTWRNIGPANMGGRITALAVAT